MTDRETLDRARLLFVGDTQGDMLAREVIEIAERLENIEAIHKAGCVLREETEQTYCYGGRWIWDEGLGRPVTTAQKELADLRAQRDELWEQLTPLKDAVLFARAQRRPMGIGQDSEIGRPTVTIEVCPRYGREKHNPGFHLETDTLGPEDAEGPSATKRIAVALLRLAYAVADKASLQP